MSTEDIVKQYRWFMTHETTCCPGYSCHNCMLAKYTNKNMTACYIPGKTKRALDRYLRKFTSITPAQMLSLMFEELL